MASERASVRFLGLLLQYVGNQHVAALKVDKIFTTSTKTLSADTAMLYL